MRDCDTKYGIFIEAFHALAGNDYYTSATDCSTERHGNISPNVRLSDSFVPVINFFPISLSLSLCPILDLSHTTPLRLHLQTLPQLSAGCCLVHTFDRSRVRSVYLFTSTNTSCLLEQPTSPPWTLRKTPIESTNMKVQMIALYYANGIIIFLIYGFYLINKLSVTATVCSRPDSREIIV